MNFYVHQSDSGKIFVKEESFFLEQGGGREPWGQAWKLVRNADSIEHARAIAKYFFAGEA